MSGSEEFVERFYKLALDQHRRTWQESGAGYGIDGSVLEHRQGIIIPILCKGGASLQHLKLFYTFKIQTLEADLAAVDNGHRGDPWASRCSKMSGRYAPLPPSIRATVQGDGMKAFLQAHLEDAKAMLGEVTELCAEWDQIVASVPRFAGQTGLSVTIPADFQARKDAFYRKVNERRTAKIQQAPAPVAAPTLADAVPEPTVRQRAINVAMFHHLAAEWHAEQAAKATK